MNLIKISINIIILLMTCSASFATTYYVCDTGSTCNAGAGSGWSTGNDSNNGTSRATPFKTISEGASNVSAGDTVIVGDGIYTGTTGHLSSVVYVRMTGTSSNWITIKAENKWGAALNGQNNQTDYGFRLRASKYVRIEDFEMYGFDWKGVYANSGETNIYIYGNKIHDIGRRLDKCGTSGGVDTGKGCYGHAGISAHNASHVTVDSNIFYAIGRLPNTPYWHHDYNHDHAIYFRAPYTTIKNNLFYDLEAGWAITLAYQSSSGSAEGAHDSIVINNTAVMSNPDREGIYFVSTYNVTFQNNISYQTEETMSGGILIYACKNGIVAKNNLFNGPDVFTYRAESEKCRGDQTASGNITNGNISFVDFSNGNYNINSDSDAIDKGLYANAPALDIDEKQRDSYPDIGAYEWNGVAQSYQCSDGIDNDQDGFIDMGDEGCGSASDNDETNVVLSYQCNDGIDNDQDGFIDMNDEGCGSASDNDETNVISYQDDYNYIVKVNPQGTYIDAENSTGTITQGTSAFLLENAISDYAGTGYLTSSGTGASSCSSANEGKEYQVNFEDTGTYNIWIRGYSLNASSDSIFVGVDGTCVGALNPNKIHNQWVWTNNLQSGTGVNTIDITTPGIHTVNIWIREPNFNVDGIYLTQGTEPPPNNIALLDSIPPAKLSEFVFE